MTSLYGAGVVALVCLIHIVTVYGQDPTVTVGQTQYQSPECKLPRRKGQCLQNRQRFYYDTKSGKCKPFTYSGCGGNLNNFISIENCNAKCVCSQPKNQGKGILNIVKFYYDVNTEKCTRFRYKGENGNSNRFASKANCEAKCAVEPIRPKCFVRPDRGSLCINNAKTQYYFDRKCNCCRSFKYNGCGGNKNRYPSYESCMDTCKDHGDKLPDRPAKCKLQPAYGNCTGVKTRFYYNVESGSCRRFIYSGCGKNGNNFNNKKSCEEICIDGIDVPVNTTLVATGLNRQYPTNLRDNTNGGFLVENILQKLNIGLNANNDLILKLADQVGLMGKNDGIESLIRLARQSGLVSGFGLNPVINEERTNDPAPTSPTPVTTTTEVPVVPTECLPAPDRGDCIFNLNRYYFDKELGMCRLFKWSGCGGNTNRFYSETHCESTCIFN